MIRRSIRDPDKRTRDNTGILCRTVNCGDGVCGECVGADSGNQSRLGESYQYVARGWSVVSACVAAGAGMDASTRAVFHK